MIKILWFLLLLIAFLTDSLLTILTLTIYLWVTPDKKFFFGKALKYYENKFFKYDNTSKF